MTNQELENKYIHLFECDSETGLPLRGIETNSGWSKPVERFLEMLDWHRLHNKKDGEENVIKIFQIKEKFGRVRVYLTSPEHINDMIENAIGQLEGVCSVTCENCGRIGEKDGSEFTLTTGWISYICTQCKNKSRK